MTGLLVATHADERSDGALLALRSGFRRWKAARHGYARLTALDDRMLKDIGLDRMKLAAQAASGGRGAGLRER